MTEEIKTPTAKQTKWLERNAQTANRRIMHKFQLNWKNMNIKYGNKQ